jgi:hypothetical protein
MTCHVPLYGRQSDMYTLDLQVHHVQANLCLALRVNVATTC